MVVSVSAMSAGVCLTIGHAVLCGDSLSAKPSDVVTHYQPKASEYYQEIPKSHIADQLTAP